jgi:hypothetical protein
MKKARSITIDGELFKYFVDTGPVDDWTGKQISKYRIILYKNGYQFFCNLDETVTNILVKQLYREGNFHGPY